MESSGAEARFRDLPDLNAIYWEFPECIDFLGYLVHIYLSEAIVTKIDSIKKNNQKAKLELWERGRIETYED